MLLNIILIIIVLVLLVQNIKLRKSLNLAKESIKIAKEMYRNAACQAQIAKEKIFKMEMIDSIKIARISSTLKDRFITDVENCFDIQELKIKCQAITDLILSLA